MSGMSEKKEAPRMDPSIARNFYLQPWVRDAIFEMAKGREIGPVYYSSQYGKRPDAIQFPADIERMAKDGITSFHCSVEHWSNALLIHPGLKRHELDELRTGFDLLFDVDSHKDMKVAQHTAYWLVKAIRAYGVENISVKFSGRRGFHIGIPYASLPKKLKITQEKGEVPLAMLYPELLQTVAQFLRAKIRPKLADALKALDQSYESEMKSEDGSLDPYTIVDIEQNWSVRHLFRMPYSFNEKTGLVSVPIDPDKILEFNADMAKAENVKPGLRFFEKSKANEAEMLVLEALEWKTHQKYALDLQEKEKASRRKKDYSEPTEAIPENMFPPCLQLILGGMKDGRKRALFILINFLQTVGWNFDDIEDRVKKWNEKNPEPLPQTIVNTQLSYARRRKEGILPPNCDNASYYSDLSIKCPENICNACKNPVVFAKRRFTAYQRIAEENAKKDAKRKKKADAVPASGTDDVEQEVPEEQREEDT